MLRLALSERAALARRLPLPGLLREPSGFRRLFASHVVSLLGDEVSMIALPLIAVLTLDAGPAQMGLLAAAGGIPALLFALPFGAWLDGDDKCRERVIAADLVRAALTLSIPVAWVLGALSAAQLYAVAFLLGTAGLVSGTAHATVFVSFVPRSLYLEASALIHAGRAGARTAGSALAGVLVHALTAPAALLVDALSFVASALFLKDARPRAPEPPDDAASDDPQSRPSVSSGVAWIVRDRYIGPMLGAVATINLFLFGFYALFVLYATTTLALPPPALGLVLAASAVGAFLGSAVTTPLSRRIGIGPTFTAGCVAFPCPLILVAAMPPDAPGQVIVVVLTVAQLASGAGLMLVDVTGGALRAALIPSTLRCQVTGAHMLVNKGMRPIGALAGGLAGSMIGVRPTLVIATCGASAALLWLLPSPVPRLRTLGEGGAA